MTTVVDSVGDREETVSRPVPSSGEGDKQSNLRKLIVQIQTDHDLDSTEKNKRIQELMCSGIPLCRPSRSRIAEVEAGENNEETAKQRNVTYHNVDEGIMGCEHYQRQAKSRAPCCGKFYTCRLCHDAEESHKIDR